MENKVKLILIVSYNAKHVWKQHPEPKFELKNNEYKEWIRISSAFPRMERGMFWAVGYNVTFELKSQRGNNYVVKCQKNAGLVTNTQPVSIRLVSIIVGLIPDLNMWAVSCFLYFLMEVLLVNSIEHAPGIILYGR